MAARNEPRQAQGKRQGAEIEGASAEALLPPIQLIVSAFHIWDGHAPKLASGHAVFQDVFTVEPCLFLPATSFAGCGQHGLSAGGELSVLLGQGELARLGQRRHKARGRQKTHSPQGLWQLGLHGSPHDRSDSDGHQQEQEVVGHLDVVGVQMQRRKQRRHPGAAPWLSTEGQHRACHHTRHGGDGAHLGGVARSQVQDVQRRQSKSNAQRQGDPRRQAQTQPQHVGRDHGYEQRRDLHGHQGAEGLPHRFGGGVHAGARDLNGGHAPKHGVRPLWHIAFHPLEVAGFLGHANVVLDVALTQPFPVEHRRGQGPSGGKKHDQHRNEVRHKSRKGITDIVRGPQIGRRHDRKVGPDGPADSVLYLLKIHVFAFF